ncbi:MAG: type II toxin-antitoxin system RelE/ParE family toxin [Devosia sp.]
MRYRLTRKAAEDVLRIYQQGIEMFGADQAARYHGRMKRTLETLARNSEIARPREELSPPARVHPCGSHIIVYTSEEGDNILVLRVRHGREDWIGSP